MPVHPRIRGERWTSPLQRRRGAGSSPHTRGTHRGRQVDTRAGRFIPAYAGNAMKRAWSAWPASVHPRIRGERRAVLGGVLGGVRFIPAYAGNAVSTSPSRLMMTVHPRIRGERTCQFRRDHLQRGSSPHTRGTRRNVSSATGLHRFIPAYAGNACLRGVAGCRSAVHPRIRGERP